MKRPRSVLLHALATGPRLGAGLLALLPAALGARSVTITALDAEASESGLFTGSYLVARTGDTAGPLTVLLSYSGTAVAAEDYQPLPASVEIPAGSASITLTLTPINDPVAELLPDVVTATVQPSAAYTVGAPSAADISIVDNETFTNTAPMLYTGYPDTETSALIFWTDNFEGETSYRVQHTPAGVTAWVTSSAPANATSHRITGLTPGASYDFRVIALRAQTAPNPTLQSFNSSSMRLTIHNRGTPPAFSTYWQWLGSNGITRSSRMTLGSATADPDGDGKANLLEYLTGGNPLSVDSAPLAVEPSGNTLALSWGAPRGLLDARLVLRESTDLSTWNDSSLTILPAGSRDTASDARGATRFFRLEPSHEAPILPESTIVCWGDSLTAYASGYPSRLASALGRTVINNGIGGDTSIQITDRMEGVVISSPAIVSVGNPAGAPVRIVASRTLHTRIMTTSNRSAWKTYSATVAEVQRVEFFNQGVKIGESTAPLQATVTSNRATNPARLIAAGHPFANGDVIHFTADPLPAPLVTGKTYLVRDTDSGGFSVAEIVDGPAVSLTADFPSGGHVARGPFILDWTHPGGTTSLSLRTHTNRDRLTHVIWMGRNNSARPHEIHADLMVALNQLKSMDARFLLLSVLNGATENPGNPYYYHAMNYNSWLAKEFPDNYVDVRTRLILSGQPTGQDLIDRANDSPPASLRSDTLHLNDAGYQVVADALIQEFQRRGW